MYIIFICVKVRNVFKLLDRCIHIIQINDHNGHKHLNNAPVNLANPMGGHGLTRGPGLTGKIKIVGVVISISYPKWQSKCPPRPIDVSVKLVRASISCRATNVYDRISISSQYFKWQNHHILLITSLLEYQSPSINAIARTSTFSHEWHCPTSVKDSVPYFEYILFITMYLLLKCPFVSSF